MYQRSADAAKGRITPSSVAPPHQNCEALQPIRYDAITIQPTTLGDNCNEMLRGSRFVSGLERQRFGGRPCTALALSIRQPPAPAAAILLNDLPSP